MSCSQSIFINVNDVHILDDPRYRTTFVAKALDYNFLYRVVYLDKLFQGLVTFPVCLTSCI